MKHAKSSLMAVVAFTAIASGTSAAEPEMLRGVFDYKVLNDNQMSELTGQFVIPDGTYQRTIQWFDGKTYTDIVNIKATGSPGGVYIVEYNSAVRATGIDQGDIFSQISDSGNFTPLLTVYSRGANGSFIGRIALFNYNTGAATETLVPRAPGS